MCDFDFEKELVANIVYLRKFALRYHARGRESDADDLVQETLLGAWASKSSFKGQSSFRTWLTAIMNNRACTIYRRAGRIEYETPDYYKAIEYRHTNPNQLDCIELSQVCSQIDRLTPEHQHVLVGMRVMGYTQEELGREGQIPEGTLKSRMHYAHKALAAAAG